ncbi:hypothetical protein JXA80_11355 [bacterium]|nr:hypothetical protein [candidate division CSSED10-310 bacterium]
MTSVNAIMFDRFSGAMVCDEQRHWNDERMKVYAADKIRSVVPPEVSARYGLYACYANTGTSAIGDELRMTIYREVEKTYQKQCFECGHEPDTFMTLSELARFTFQIIVRMKHAHTDAHLMQKYGFTTAELISGRYQRNGRDYSITQAEVIENALKEIALKPNTTAMNAVFGNGGIIAGFDRQEGFGIFNYAMKEAFMERVECGYVALGSGGDTTNFVLPRWFNTTGVQGRETGVDPVDGLIAIIDAVNMATEHNLGVDGYYNIILFDGSLRTVNGPYIEINDHRSRLTTEFVRADRAGLITRAVCREGVDGILRLGRDVTWGEELLWSSTQDVHTMHRLFRGYPVTLS